MIQTSVRRFFPLWTAVGLLSAVVPPLSAQEPLYLPIPIGTRVPVVTLGELSSKTAKKGNKLTLEVTGDVVVNGRTVIAKGAPIWGVIADVKKAGRFDADGALILGMDSVKTVDGKTVALVANLRDQSLMEDDAEEKAKDKSQLGEGAAKAVKALPGGELATGFFKRGDDIIFGANSKIPVFIASYVVLQLIDSTPAAAAAVPAAAPAKDSSGSVDSSSTSDSSSAAPPNEQAIFLIDGIETWGRALGAMTAHLGSTPEIRAFGTRMMKEHAALQARGAEFAKTHKVDIPPLAPADQTSLNEVLKTLRGTKGTDFDQAILQRIQGLAQNVINVFEEGGAPSMEELIADAVKTWTVNAGEAQKLSSSKK